MKPEHLKGGIIMLKNSFKIIIVLFMILESSCIFGYYSFNKLERTFKNNDKFFSSLVDCSKSNALQNVNKKYNDGNLLNRISEEIGITIARIDFLDHEGCTYIFIDTNPQCAAGYMYVSSNEVSDFISNNTENLKEVDFYVEVLQLENNWFAFKKNTEIPLNLIYERIFDNFPK